MVTVTVVAAGGGKGGREKEAPAKWACVGLVEVSWASGLAWEWVGWCGGGLPPLLGSCLSRPLGSREASSLQLLMLHAP